MSFGMPHRGESVDQYLHRLDAISGKFMPRATPEQIAELKSKGYELQDLYEVSGDEDYKGFFGWLHPSSGEFQDSEPSFGESDAWALALEHSKAADTRAGYYKAHQHTESTP